MVSWAGTLVVSINRDVSVIFGELKDITDHVSAG